MGELRMSGKERIRLEALSRVKRRELTVVAAAEVMGLSLRQARRVWKRFQHEGDGGLVHRLRGRSSNRRLDQDLAQRIVKRHQERYADFGPTLACEKLAQEDLIISPNTLTALLKERGLWQRRRRRGRHRQRRERRACFGSMVQMDGSHHDWFEGRARKCVLMVLIDDATSRTYARFYPAETTVAAFDVFGRWVKRHGLPRSVYVDRHSIYRDDDLPDSPLKAKPPLLKAKPPLLKAKPPLLKAKPPLTQFGRAMKELSVELICAHSPQAKGRVERRNAVFQDRLVKELRLRNISDMGQANALLEKMFLDDLNRRWAVKAKRDQDLHRALEAEVKLEQVLCEQQERVVGNDWCVRWKNRWLQIAAIHANLRLPGRRVRIKELGDATLLAEHQGRRLEVRELTAKPAPPRQRRPIVNNQSYQPAAHHPWNRPAVRQAVPRASPAPAAPARDLHAEKKRKAG